MKKLVGFLGLILISGLAQADVFDRTKQKEYVINFSSSSNAATGTTTYTLIDLSDTVNWPHKEKGEIHITSIQAEFDKLAASTTTLRLGVINYVGASTGSVTWFYTRREEVNVSNTNTTLYSDYPDYGINTRVKAASTADTDGTTPYILSIEKTSGSSAFKLNQSLPTISGGSNFPAVGDIVIEINKPSPTAVNINYNIRVKYFSEN